MVSVRKDTVSGFHKGGQLRTSKVFSLIVRTAYWPLKYDNFKKWLGSCKACLANNVEQRRVSGNLRPQGSQWVAGITFRGTCLA